MWAWVVTEADGGEGIPAMTMNIPGNGPTFMPMIGADETRIRSLESHARHIAEQSGVPVRLVRFTGMEDVQCN